MYRILSVVGLAVALVCGSNAIARGNLVADPSFESPGQADGGWFPGFSSSWNVVADSGGGGTFGILNPDDTTVPGTTYVSVEQPGYLPNPADGLQSAYEYIRAGRQTYIYQQVGNPSIDKVYTLKSAVG